MTSPLSTTNIIATSLLAIMAALLLWGAATNSATMDELSHIPAGYSYVATGDMRINPEHPPFIKSLAGLPLLLLDLSLPLDHPSWTTEVNSQWSFGAEFLWHRGNPANTIVFLARLGPIALTLLLGWVLYIWAKERGGALAGILATTLYAFNPLFLGHGYLVTTDIGAAAGVLIATYFLWRYFVQPSTGRLAASSIMFGLALLTKFSLFILIPYFAMLACIWCAALRGKKTEYTLKNIVGGTVLIGIAGFAVVWLVYLIHTWNMPVEREIRDAEYLVRSFPNRAVAQVPALLAEFPLTRHIAWWVLGLWMVIERSSAGNTTYFLGEVSNLGWPHYFPFMYLVKMPVAFHVLTLGAGLFAARAVISQWRRTVAKTKKVISGTIQWFRVLAATHFPELALFLFIALYWALTLRSPLNIGVRHLAPTIPPLILLISVAASSWVQGSKKDGVIARLSAWVLGGKTYPVRETILTVLVASGVLGVLAQSPHYLSYFNALGGGTDNGWRIAVDSNYDWGQDMKRLAQFVKENDIAQIRVDYFGASESRYYLNSHVTPYNPLQEGPVQGWLAVSVSFLQRGRGEAVPGFAEPTGYYRWLDAYSPIARAGKSIFIYYIP